MISGGIELINSLNSFNTISEFWRQFLISIPEKQFRTTEKK